jgi:hypothetical protein
MSDRCDFYFRQKVTEAELDLAFSLLEKADRDLAADLNIYGIVAGAVPAPHAPVPDLTVDLTAPARAYDNLGQRVFFGTGQTVDCAVDLVGIPTEVATTGNERWLGIFLRFKRQLSDPRTDGNSQQMFFRRDESFELVVRQAPEGKSGVASKPALQADELLVCDVRRRPGQTQILAADIDTSRRQAFIFAQGSSVSVVTGAWSILHPLATTVQAALDETDAELRDHFTAAARRHSATAIDFAAHGFLPTGHVQGALNKLVDDLTGASGATRIGTDAAAGTPNALPAGNVKSQIAQLLGFLNTHVGAVSNAHNAAAIAVTDAGNNLNAKNVEAALTEALDAIGEGHFRGNEANAGQHRSILQPALGGTKALILDSNASGQSASHLRIYADESSIWLTLNAWWKSSQWVRDDAGLHSVAIRFARTGVELLCESSSAASFTRWPNVWRLPMGETVHSGFELSGNVREVGRLGMEWSNSYNASRSCAGGGAVTFRNRFPATPSSITLSPTSTSKAFSGAPIISEVDRDGFGFFSHQTIAAAGSAHWFGSFIAIS